MLETRRARIADRGFTWNIAIAVSFLSAFFAVLIAVSDLSIPERLQSPLSWIAVTAWFAISVFVFMYSRSRLTWKNALQTSVGDRSKVSANFHEQFGYLIVALLALCVVAFANGAEQSLWPWKVDFQQEWQIALFCGALILSFVPLLIAIKRHDQLVRDGAFLDNLSEDHISDGSIWISIFIVFLLACLAWAAGKRLIDLDGWYGPAVMATVVSSFLFFIFLPSLLRVNPHGKQDYQTAASGVAIGAGKLASVIDSWFATKIAPLTGATQTGNLPPHIFLLSVFVPLTIMGYALSNGWGLVPIGLAFLLAVSLGRRWAWVESDRETAMRIQKTRGRGIKIGFGNDLRDEALLGYAFLFVLVPLALRQIQMIAAPFEFETGAIATSATLTDWASFFGTELAKAVPIVDWADIYGLENDASIQAKSESARHLVFFSRLMVDAIIIAALLQAWSIMQRNKSQRELFNNGQLDMLDPFAERALFSKGVDRDGRVTTDLVKVFTKRVNAAKGLGLSTLPYNQQRLNEIVEENDADHPELKIVADFLVQEYGLLAGSTPSRIEQLRIRWDLASDKHWNCPSWLRNQRLDFEKLMDETHDDRARNKSWAAFSDQQCLELSALLSHVVKMQEFVNAKEAAFELLGDVSASFVPMSAVIVLAGRLFDEDGIPEKLEEKLGPNVADWNFAREPLQERRASAVAALARIYLNDRAPKGTKRLCKSILEWVSLNENQKPRDAAMGALQNTSASPLKRHGCEVCQ